MTTSNHQRKPVSRKINVTHDVHPYKGGWWPQGHGIGYADSFVIEVAEFIRSIAEDTAFSPDFEDGVKCQEILEAVEKSASNQNLGKSITEIPDYTVTDILRIV